MNSIERGAWAGILATSSMTASMARLYRNLRSQKVPLPPAILTGELEKAVGVAPRHVRRRGANETLILHFAYGALGGIIYSSLLGGLRGYPALKGGAFGLCVWAGSYLGWVPVLGMKPSARETSADRNALMIVAHLVWGATLGWAEHELNRYGDRMFSGPARRLPR